MAPWAGNREGHVVDRLVAYFTGSLTEEDEQAVDAHLLGCPACLAEFEALGDVALIVSAGRPASGAEPPVGGRRWRPARAAALIVAGAVLGASILTGLHACTTGSAAGAATGEGASTSAP
jgi:anti-sigma factor RsiW